MNYRALGIAPTPVFKAVLDEIPALHGKKILDVPCGGGGFASHLTAKGAECVGMDIVPADEHRPMVLSDMNRAFPFADEAFDLVLSIEGIEHIHDPFHVIGECFRVLKPGGTLILSTPNVHNVRSRAKFLLRGTLYWFDPYEIGRIGHVNVVPYFILKHIVRTVGFSEPSVRGSANVRPHVPGFICRFMQRVLSRSDDDEAELNSPTLVNAENLIVSAAKPDLE